MDVVWLPNLWSYPPGTHSSMAPNTGSLWHQSLTVAFYDSRIWPNCSQLGNNGFKTWPLSSSNLILSFFISIMYLQAWCAWMLQSGGLGPVLWEVNLGRQLSLWDAVFSERCRKSSFGYGFNGELIDVLKTHLVFLCHVFTTWEIGCSIELPNKCEEERVNATWYGRVSVSQVVYGRSCRVQELRRGLESWMMRLMLTVQNFNDCPLVPGSSPRQDLHTSLVHCGNAMSPTDWAKVPRLFSKALEGFKGWSHQSTDLTLSSTTAETVILSTLNKWQEILCTL